MGILNIKDFAVWISDPRDNTFFPQPIGRAQSGADQIRSIKEVAEIAFNTLVCNPDRSLQIDLARPSLDELRQEYGLLSKEELKQIASNHELAMLLVNIGFIASYKDLEEYGFRFPTSQGHLNK